MILTASNLVRAINNLPKRRRYNYINPRTKGIIEIANIDLPEGPIYIKRYNPSRGKSASNVKEEPISPQLIWRVANAISENIPFNIDRIVGASYNTRSVLETLLAHTPEFYYCYPGRIELINAQRSRARGHKHLMWVPSNPHKEGITQKIETDIVISEIPSRDAYYDSLVLSNESGKPILDIDIKRRHAQIQVALLMIGKQLGFRTWIAKNDINIKYKDKTLAETEGVIRSLNSEALISNYSDAIKVAKLVDCIWFKNGRLMPAVMEIEHTTGIKSGLTRMKNLYDILPPFETRYVIVADDGERGKLVKEANKQMFKELKVKFFPYSAVEELYSLCERRKIQGAGITDKFLDSFMEPMVN